MRKASTGNSNSQTLVVRREGSRGAEQALLQLHFAAPSPTILVCCQVARLSGTPQHHTWSRHLELTSQS